jgi:DNA polymerase V
LHAIVDCNSFYCSCERLFRPDLREKPVVVLSNNDGCIISRTDEARRLGVGMAAPYYQNRDIIREHDVAVFSSNYHLYGDMSARVMDTLRFLAGEGNGRLVEVYSVDEAFMDLGHMPATALQDFSVHIRDTVEQWTGIRVSVGVASTRVLSKVANRLAKKEKQRTGCVLVLDTEDEVRDALQRTEVGDIWGVGGRYAHRLRNEFGINTAWQLRQVPAEWARKNLGGVVGLRLIRELRGESCLPLKDPLEKKKMIATTRMFGKPVFDLQPLREAVATFTARAAEKLRRQHSAAGAVDVFVVTNGSNGNLYEYNPKSDHRYALLPRPTSLTQELISFALPLVDSLHRPGTKYLKAGIVLSGLVPDDSRQGNLFQPEAENHRRLLMDAIDNINFSMRDDAVRFLASGLTRNWKMRQELRSRRFTTRWEEMFDIQ